MKVPASTIVMGLVTCSLFGVAIRETVMAKDPIGYDDEVDVGGTVGIDEVESEPAEETERGVQESWQSAQYGSARRDLLGAEVASLGTSFGRIALGTPTGSIESLQRAMDAAQTASHSRISVEGDGVVERVRISHRGYGEAPRDEFCQFFTEELTLRWGTPEGDTEDARWTNPSTKTRASLSERFDTDRGDLCELVLERFVDPAQWIAKDAASVVPVWAVGQPVARLQQAIAPRGAIEWYDEHAELAWSAPGFEHRTGATELIAYVVKGKVVAVEAGVELSSEDADLVTARVTSLYGTATTDDDIVYAWAGKPRITLSVLGDGMRITVGKIP